MSKMTVIQLLNKIANGEEVPSKIRINETLYWFDDRQKQYIYVSNEEVDGCSDIYSNTLILTYEPFGVLDEFLNTEVEIIEEDKKIEKLDVIAYDKCIHKVTHKEKELALEIRETQIVLNELIDEVNKLKEKE